MRSASETKWRRGIQARFTVLILLWVLDKLIMLAMIWLLK